MARRLSFLLLAALLMLPSLLTAQDDASLTIEFYGEIQSANTTAIVINGQIVDIQGAQIETPLVAGLTVRVSASIAPNLTIIAREVETIPPAVLPGIVEFTGTVTAFTDTTLTLGMQIFHTHAAASAGRVAVGERAQVFASYAPSDGWVARAVIAADVLPPVTTPEVNPQGATTGSTPIPPVQTPEVLPPVSTPEVADGEDFRVEGIIEAVDNGAITVNGQRYLIGNAQVEGALVVGAEVRIEVRMIGGQPVVEEVEVRD